MSWLLLSTLLAGFGADAVDRVRLDAAAAGVASTEFAIAASPDGRARVVAWMDNADGAFSLHAAYSFDGGDV